MTYDPKAESRSLMHKQKVLCNGQATGAPCKHYWNMIRIVPSHNPDFLKLGEKLRFCRAWGAEPLEFGEGTTELAVHCSMYEPDLKREFDPHFEDYSPMNEEEAEQAGLSIPSPPLPVITPPLLLCASLPGSESRKLYRSKVRISERKAVIRFSR